MSICCCVSGCDNTADRYPSKGTFYEGRFLRFPEHPDKRKIWNKIVGSNTIVAKFICLEHFTDDDWRFQDIIMNVPVAKRKLKPNALPSRKLPTKVVEVKEMDEQTRKRLVSEALAEYDMNHSDSHNSTLSRGRALSRRMRCPSIDEQTRKRLVAEALAAYEMNYSEGNDNGSSDVKPSIRQKDRNNKTRVTQAENTELKEDINKQTHDATLTEYNILYPDSNDNDSSDVKPTAGKECFQNTEMQGCIEYNPVFEMEIPYKECNLFAAQTRKCGEVILDIDGQNFALNCSLCPGIFLNFLNFSNHVLTEHSSLLEKCNSNPLDDNDSILRLDSNRNNNDSSDVKPTPGKECFQNTDIQGCIEYEPVYEMEIPYKECNLFAAQTLKCGEVILDIDGQNFALNCSLCPRIFQNFLNFLKHALTEHPSLLEQYNNNPLDKDAKYNKKPMEKQYDFTSFHNEPSTGILQETIFIDTISSGDKLQNNYILDSDNEESISNIEISKINETNELNMDNQALIMQIIYLLKQSQFHLIWNEKHPAYECYKKRRETIAELITLLVKSFPKLSFTINNMQSLLTQLRRSYIKELRRRKEANQNNEPYLCNLWCFDELKFFGEDFKILKRFSQQESIKYNLKIAKQQPLESLFKSNSTETEQTIIEIIEVYEKYPTLWNIKYSRYRGKLKDNVSLSQFQLMIQKKKLQIFLDEQTTLVQLLKHMHCWYSNEETLRQQSIRVNQDFKSSSPRIYAALEFLRGNVPPFKCKACENNFNSEYNYIRHIRNINSKCGILNIDTINECQYCQKRFETPAKLECHVRTHTDERPYTCQICGKKFHNNCNLFGHKRIHNKKSFKCDICERFYHTASILRIHQKTHLGIRDKMCDICGKSFTNSQNLYRHQHLHRETPKFECKFCGKRYKTFASMFIHRKRCTNVMNANKQEKKNKEKVTKKLNKSAAESKRDTPVQNCSKGQSLNEAQTLVIVEKQKWKIVTEMCQVDAVKEEPRNIHEDI